MLSRVLSAAHGAAKHLDTRRTRSFASLRVTATFAQDDNHKGSRQEFTKTISDSNSGSV